ncbi:MAG: AI-2E family transporter [Microvirga sp.]|nr:AI-2E family transporter [Microvirga sp.]
MTRDDDHAYRARLLPPRRRTTALVVLFATLTLILIFAPDFLLIVFAGLLFGVFFSGGGEWLARRLGIGRGWGIGLFVLLVTLALVGPLLAFAPAMAEQFDTLVREVPDAIGRLRARIEEYAWGESLLRRATPGALMPEDGGGAAATVAATTFGALGSFLIMLIVGLYVALDPQTYRRGFLSILAPSMRAGADEMLGESIDKLRNWIVAQLMSMAVVGLLTWFGLWMIGVPLAPILGLIAAILAFIPNIGPIIAAAPAVLLGFAESPTTALMVIGVYLAVQTVEGYAITPLIQQERVSLPPALVITMQLLMGVLFGILGLALATPLAALGMTLVRKGYVERYLENERREDEAPVDPSSAT